MLKNLKSLFIVDDKEDAAKAQPKEGASQRRPGTTPSSAPSGKTPPTRQSAAPPPNASASANERMTNQLLQAIDAANLEGFDYLEYKRAVKGLQKFSMDEVTQYRSAFTTASTMGVTLSELVSSAQHYLHVLDTERDKFQNSFDAEYAKKVTQADADVKRLQQEINDKAEQIKKLQQDIEKRKQQMAKLEDSAQSRRTKILGTRDAFLASYQQVRGVIANDIERMKRYLT